MNTIFMALTLFIFLNDAQYESGPYIDVHTERMTIWKHPSGVIHRWEVSQDLYGPMMVEFMKFPNLHDFCECENEKPE